MTSLIGRRFGEWRVESIEVSHDGEIVVSLDDSCSPLPVASRRQSSNVGDVRIVYATEADRAEAYTRATVDGVAACTAVAVATVFSEQERMIAVVEGQEKAFMMLGVQHSEARWGPSPLRAAYPAWKQKQLAEHTGPMTALPTGDKFEPGDIVAVGPDGRAVKVSDQPIGVLESGEPNADGTVTVVGGGYRFRILGPKETMPTSPAPAKCRYNARAKGDGPQACVLVNSPHWAEGDKRGDHRGYCAARDREMARALEISRRSILRTMRELPWCVECNRQVALVAYKGILTWHCEACHGVIDD